MSIEKSVLEKLESLTPEQQAKLREFLDSLEPGNGPKRPRQSLLGIFKDFNVHITEEDIDEARREMWGNFPREDI
jgi:hypothetical protein